jgi:hypothetical protein
MYLTKSREILDFVRAVQRAQAAMPHVGLDQVIAETAAVLGVQTPSEIEYRAMLVTVAQTPRNRSRGHPRSEAQTKSEAVAALVVYFESLGYRPEHALRGALHCLCLDGHLSRKCAREAVAKYKAMTAPDQYEILARMVYTTRWPGTKLIPPGMMKLRAKSTKD